MATEISAIKEESAKLKRTSEQLNVDATTAREKINALKKQMADMQKELEKEEKTVARFPDTPIAEDLQIEPVLTNKLNKLRIGLPEAYYYWAMTSQLLAK